MKLSKFVLEQPQGGNILLKQLMTGAVISLSKSDYEEIASGNHSRLDRETLEGLQECRFLIDGNEDEHFLNEFHKWTHETNWMTVYFAPTTGCNFDCDYCYEDGIDRTLFMTELIVNKSIDWLRDYLVSHPEIEKLNVVLHGGEPTLHKKAIKKFLICAATICEAHGIEMITGIVTNGARLDDQFAKLLSRYNLYRTQITLDGFREIHDARRPFKNGHGSYDTILANLRNLVTKGYSEKVLLRINIDELNLSQTGAFLEFLANDPQLKGRIQVSLGVVTPTSGCNGHASSAEQYVASSRLKAATDTDEYLGLIATARSHGFDILDDFMVGPWCAARLPHAWMIGPLGELYKCTSDLGRLDRAVGYVDGPVDTTAINNLSKGRMKECLRANCALVPICGGGCLFDHRSEPGSACRKEFLMTVNRGLMVHQDEE